MNKGIIGKISLFVTLIFILSLSHTVNATTNLVTGNNSAAPVNNLLLNFSWHNSTTFIGVGATYNSTVNITFNLPSGIFFISNSNSTNMTSGLDNVSLSNSTTVVFGNATANDTTDTGSWLAFNISAVASGIYNITVNETYNLNGGAYWLFNNTILMNITQGSTSINLYLNGSQVNQTSIYPNSTINATAVSNVSELSVIMWRNDSLLDNAASRAWNITQLGVGSQYNFTAQVIGNANYSNSSITSLFWNVTQGAASLNLYINGSQVNQTSVYPNSTINVTATSNVSVLYVQLWRNDTLIHNATSTAWNITQLGVNTSYNFTTQVLGNENYTASSATALWLNVSKGTLSLSLSVPNVTYPSNTTATVSETNIGDADVNYTVYRNTSGLVTFSTTNGTAPAGETTLLGTGAYLYVFNTSGDAFANWTVNTTGINTNVTVSRGITSLTLNITPSTTVTNPTATNASGSGCPAQGASDVNCTLWRNNVYITSANASNSSDPVTLNTGTWIYNYSTDGGSNWTSNSTTLTLTVSAASSVPSSGGGGPAPSPTTKVTVARGNANITVPSIAASKMANVTITKYDDVAFRQINISVSNSVNNIKIIITKLAGLPASVTHEISGKAYHYIQIDKTNFTDTDVNKVFIKFAVNKTWLNISGIDKTNVSLYRWTDKWNELTTTYLSEDSSEVFYQAESPGFSYFLIGTKAGEVTPTTQPICTENWSCTDWSACAAGTQTRACTDSNSCGTTLSKPAETQSCIMKEEVKPGMPSWIVYSASAIVLIAIAIILFIFRKKMFKPSKKK